MANVLTKGTILTDNVIMQRVWAITQCVGIDAGMSGTILRAFRFQLRQQEEASQQKEEHQVNGYDVASSSGSHQPCYTDDIDLLRVVDVVASQYAHSFLVSTLGASAAILGLIEGIADGLAGIARLAGGALADDPIRRRTTAVGGYSSTAVFSALTELRGSAFGFLAAVQSFGNIIASTIADVLWILFPPAAAFLYLAVWMFISLVVLMWLALPGMTRSS